MENYKKIKQFDKTFAEFFAGIGLMRMGLERSGWKIKFANDIDPKKEKLYQNHFQDEKNHFLLDDIHNISGDDIPEISLATASFPCTDLSLAGRREGLKGSQSSAFWGFVKILEEMKERRPPLVLLENVEGFLTSHKGKDFKEALLALNQLNYSVDAFIINASQFVPQSRVRLFIIGKKRFPSQKVNDKQLTFYQSEIRNSKLANFILQHPEIDWNIKNLPPLPEREEFLKDIVEEIPDSSKEWWSEERVQYLLNQTFDRHLNIINAALNRDEFNYFTAFRRIREGRSMAEIRSDGIAGCLRTPKGGSAKQILLKVGKGEVKIRYVSPREYARLMGANDFNITGTFNEALFGFGDAVCVPVVTWIANNYLNPVLEEFNSHQAKYGQRLSAFGV